MIPSFCIVSEIRRECQYPSRVDANLPKRDKTRFHQISNWLENYADFQIEPRNKILKYLKIVSRNARPRAFSLSAFFLPFFPLVNTNHKGAKKYTYAVWISFWRSSCFFTDRHFDKICFVSSSLFSRWNKRDAIVVSRIKTVFFSYIFIIHKLVPN